MAGASITLRCFVDFVTGPAGFIASRHHVAPTEATTNPMAARIVNFLAILVAKRFIFDFPFS
jgi:hypothetical protein